jgi:hypothetical protein
MKMQQTKIRDNDNVLQALQIKARELGLVKD